MRIGALKVVLDGGILIGTAYLRAPYGQNTEVYGYSDPDYRGVLRVPREKLIEIVKLAHRFGWQMSAHTTGGASTDLLLDAYEEADREKSIRERRFTLIHSNFHNERSIARAKRLNVIADLQRFTGPTVAPHHVQIIRFHDPDLVGAVVCRDLQVILNVRVGPEHVDDDALDAADVPGVIRIVCVVSSRD